MPDWLSIHEPVVINTVGHAAGVVIFSILLYYFLINWRRAGEEHSSLPLVAAALAMVWNLGSLIALATGPSGGAVSDLIAAASFSVLSFLPAVLLQISLEPRQRAVWISGYVLSITAAILHVCDLLTGAPRLHYAALLLVTLGFAGLTAFSVLVELRTRNRAAGSRLAGSMGLFLFAISFAHFQTGHPASAWSQEIALHHAGIPLALLVLLQNYRFLLLDAFLRFVVSGTLAAGALVLAIRVMEQPAWNAVRRDPFQSGLLFVAGSLFLALFVSVRNVTQGFLTRVIFLRANVDGTLKELQQLERATDSETDYLRCSAGTIVRFLRTSRFKLTQESPSKKSELSSPTAVLGSAYWPAEPWVQAVLPMRFSRGDATYLLLGPREGGRRYLSEDLGILARLGATTVEHVEQLRNRQMESLVSQAELKALQAQINPHFLFNSLNTLYGTIDRNNAEARRLVLNLADVFRYLLRSERTLVDVEEELRIVRAYLEIEQVRLGAKLRAEIEVESQALHVRIPLLSIQPIVENAVKHGVASRAEAGFVRLSVQVDGTGVRIEVTNSGEWDLLSPAGSGVGMANVRRRLELCYGPSASFDVRAGNGTTTASFAVPVKPSPVPAAV
jgi:two-component system, LytTR family, sensor kinase